VWRVAVQWPLAQIPIARSIQVAREVLEQIRAQRGHAALDGSDMAAFQLSLLRRLRDMGAAVAPCFYDVPDALVERHFPGSAAGGFPSGLLIEEPPFVLPRPWRTAGERELETKALVIKTPSNAYRLPFIRALFPNAAIKIVHLTRNPAASINGLYDGWRFRGFHSHRMPEPLRIPGYTDHCPADARWWKFDLPPGWQEYTSAPLLDVCAFQWRAANRAIRSFVRDAAPPSIQMRYEDLLRSPDSRIESLERLCHWLSIPFDGRVQKLASEGIRPVVATTAPRANRWRDRAELMRRALDSRVRLMAEELGYGPESEWV
jgi:hypothetical protein